jgi:2'-5' RNA ligase
VRIVKSRPRAFLDHGQHAATMRAMAEENTGGMVALVPSEDSAKLLALSTEDGEPADELHLTLTYLGDDVSTMNESDRRAIVKAAEKAAETTPPVSARVFAHATFNPDGHEDRKPCAVYLVGGTDELDDLRREFDRFASEEQHQPYIPHVTAGYGLTAADLSFTGPVTFDAIRVALGDANIMIPLTGGKEESSADGDGDESGLAPEEDTDD